MRSAERPAPGAQPLRAVAGNIATKLAIYPLSLAASIVVDRTLGAHEKGLFAFLLLIGNFVLPLLTFGFGGAVVYSLSAGKRAVADIACTSLLVGLGQGTLCALLMLVAWLFGVLGATGSELTLTQILPMLCLAPLQGVQMMTGRILLGESRFSAANWLMLSQAIANPLLLFITVVLLRMGLRGAITATVILNVLLTAANITLISPRRMRWRYDHGFFREGMRYGIKIWVGDLATRANLRLDQLLLGVFAPPVALGNYVVAVTLSETLWIAVDAGSPVLFNRLAAQKTEADRVEMTDRVHRIGLVAMLALAVVAGVLGWLLIPPVFGVQFTETAVLFLLLLPGAVALFPAKILTKYFAAAGRPELAGRVGLLSGLTGAIGYVLLVPWQATLGAALASTVSYALMSCFAIYYYVVAIKPQVPQLFLPTKADIGWLRALSFRR